MPLRPNARVLRDMTKRQSVTSHELLRRAFKYVARNTTLPFRVRHQAQLQLNQFPTSSRPVEVKERCIETGRGRGILTEFGLCRYQFRLKARAGQLIGVRKSSW
ncbi:uncharacterized protein FA14DRAFT_117951 [Meira miltonrushii]|uniref:Glucocorticoid receptor-like (DNA-binding domain) n=1 Tax=Meira miltonrushii TaxID=1280837 RepID=A0A316VIL8_9BASI|nr:uncharacterized protein FA14DRAFT_117951 [Meira miltonrushii]PWN37479.1 hypothetical protein FA14DRAFT_117951 [Meira miltonrushii]